jgi:protein-S-isoprenylcysteine O-methyltransferase Ste14
VVKRGWVHTQIPSVLTPSLTVAWAVLLVSAAAVHLLWFHRQRLR